MKRRTYKGLAGCGVLILANALPAQAQNQVQLVGQNTLLQQSAPPATLQVTGTAQSFTLLVNRADVQDVLKLVFDQGQKQFTLDAGVTGQVTLRLINQPIKAVLDAVCRQTFLKYQIQNGVFVFSRDEEAVKRAILSVRALNAQLRDQLRLMGLDMPPEVNFYSQRSGASGFGGGFGGAANGLSTNALGVSPYNNLRKIQVAPGVAQELLNIQRGGRAADSSSGKAGNTTQKLGSKSDVTGGQGERSNPKAEVLQKTDGSTTDAPNIPAGVNGTFGFAPDTYSMLLKDNGLYSINTQGAQVPVSDILTELGRQSGVTVLLDPDLPKDDRFRMRGKVPPRTLEEMLNYLAPRAQLEWRRIGSNVVLVSPTPEFQLFFGAERQPRLSYPNAQNSTLRSRAQEPADTRDVKTKDTADKKPLPEKPKDDKEKGKGKEPR